ncbi:hypothetical protein MLD38_006685 [Melastoma candidum]|uniref:Uncharacterized protein n=1 Tax=Melastoma candidum TaxID=119954 RepID=A0ACB9RNE1_9MYRT|nr:hypothetical protein MLD38_006685 [Melastoma candidum]
MACKKASDNLIFSSLACLVLVLQMSGASCQGVQGGYWFPGSGVSASGIDSTLFTHLFCAFADLDTTTNTVVVSSANTQPFSTFTADVQQTNPNVVTLLSIGGGASSPGDFSNMASQTSSRQSFIDSSISLARSYGFDGLDLDWEYPESDTAMSNLALLLNEWRAAITAEAQSSGKDPLLLTAAVYYSSIHDGISYPVSSLSSSLDWINMMDYDFYGPGWSSVTGPPAALYNPGNQVSGDNGVTAWLQAGMPVQQMALGFPFYGRAWTLQDANDNGFFAPATGAAISSDGAIVYNQILSFITQNSATAAYNSTYVSNYCYSGTTWIGYDDTESISTKVAYAKEKGLLGYFTWHVGGDSNWALSQQASTTWNS